MDLTPDRLQRSVPGISRATAEAWAAPLWAAAVEFGIDDPNEFAAALASISNESHLERFEEESYFGTPVERIQFVFGSARTPPVETMREWKQHGRQYFDEQLFNWLYDDRRPANPKLGNTEDGDGHKRRGLGPLQITGGDNEKAVSAETGTDFYANPDLLKDPVEGSRAAMAYLKINRITKPAADGSESGFLKSVRKSNPGLAESEFRTHHLQRWYEVRRGLGITGGGVDVAAVQAALNALPTGLPQLKVDGDLGPKTAARLREYQASVFLPVTGTPDAATLAKLDVRAAA